MISYETTEAGQSMGQSVKLKGTNNGYKRGAKFELTNGQIWEQTCSTYRYRYSYRADAEIQALGSRGSLKLEGLDNSVTVKKVK